MACLVAVGLGSSPTEAIQGSQVRWKGSKGRQHTQKQALLQFLRTHMKTKWHTPYICVGVLGLSHACSLVGVSVSVSPYGLFDSIGFLMISLTSCFLQYLFFLFHKIPWLNLMLGYGSLHLFSLAADWSLSVDSYARFLFARIAEYH